MRTKYELEVQVNKDQVTLERQLKVEEYVEQLREIPRDKPVAVKTLHTVQRPKETFKVQAKRKDLHREVPVVSYKEIPAGSRTITQEKLEPSVKQVDKNYVVQTAKVVKSVLDVPLEEEAIVKSTEHVKKSVKEERLAVREVRQVKTHQLNTQEATEVVVPRQKDCPGPEVLTVEAVRVDKEESVRRDNIVVREVKVDKEATREVLRVRDKIVEKVVPVENPVTVQRVETVQVVTNQVKDLTVKKRVPVVKPVGVPEDVNIVIERLKEVPHTFEVPVETVVYHNKDVEIPVDRIVTKNRDVQVKVEKIVAQEVPVEVILEKTTERVVRKEVQVEVPIETVRYNDVVENVPVERVEYKEVDLPVEVDRLVIRNVEVDVTVQNLVERVEVKERDVEVPVERIEYVEGQVVEVPVERLVIQDKEISVSSPPPPPPPPPPCHANIFRTK